MYSLSFDYINNISYYNSFVKKNFSKNGKIFKIG
nr:MAG TPA: hypothetical protein [Bacteriophage sp.]